ncbi:MAG: hypothetical protein WBD99_10995 [Thermodesulfobacteriota bacterium]
MPPTLRQQRAGAGLVGDPEAKEWIPAHNPPERLVVRLLHFRNLFSASRRANFTATLGFPVIARISKRSPA